MASTGLGRAVLGLSTSFTSLAVASVCLRFYANKLRGRSWRVHDWLVALAVIFAVMQCVTAYFQVYDGGLGEHVKDSSFLKLENMFKAFTANNIAWILSTNAIKLSVLIFYLDIFSVRASFRRVTYAYIIFVIAYAIAGLLCLFTICRPFAATWDKTIPGGKCGNVMLAMTVTSAINTVEDLIVVVMPMPLIWGLQISREKKFGMMALLAVGLLICVISVMRLVTSLYDKTDYPRTLAYQVIFMNLEVEIGIINACIPTIRPLFKRQSQKHSKPSYVSSGQQNTIGSSKNLRASTEKRPMSPDDELIYEDKI